MKKLLLSFALGLIFFPSVALGAVTYSRSPLGLEVSSPLTYNVSFTDYISDTGLSFESIYWGIKSEDIDGVTVYQSNCISTSVQSGKFVIDSLVGHNSKGIVFVGYQNSLCDVVYNNGEYIEYNNENSVFLITGLTSSFLVGRTGSNFYYGSSGSGSGVLGLFASSFQGMGSFIFVILSVIFVLWLAIMIFYWGRRKLRYSTYAVSGFGSGNKDDEYTRNAKRKYGDKWNNSEDFFMRN